MTQRLAPIDRNKPGTLDELYNANVELLISRMIGGDR